MKNKRRLGFGFFTSLLLSILSACVHTDGPYRGKVIELETGNPIEGAVVAAIWMIEPYVHSERLCDAKETLTNQNGEFELPEGRCTSHPFAEMYKPEVVIFKPGYLAYPPLGATFEERKALMPGFTGDEFKDERQYNIIRLGNPKTKEQRRLSYSRTGFSDDEARKKLPILLRLLNEERKNLGLPGMEE